MTNTLLGLWLTIALATFTGSMIKNFKKDDGLEFTLVLAAIWLFWPVTVPFATYYLIRRNMERQAKEKGK